MIPIEFYTYESEVWYRQGSDCNKLSESSTEVIDFMINQIEELYPEAYKALFESYKQFAIYQPTFRLRMVSRFVKCNFALIDETEKDITADGNFRFEHISCPLRGECPFEGIICHPKFNSQLSEAEKKVLKLLFNGVRPNDIAIHLIKSPYTIKNHIRNAYKKLNVHSYQEFCMYVEKNNIF